MVEVPQTIDRQATKDLQIRLILDNATHKHDNVRQWLDPHPRLALPARTNFLTATHVHM